MSNKISAANKIRAAVVALCAVAVALFVGVALCAPSPTGWNIWLAVLVIGAAAVMASNFYVVTREASSVSGAAMVLVASIVVFRTYDFLLGPMIVGAIGAITFVQLRQRAWQKVVFNLATQSIAVLCGALIYWQMTPDGRPTGSVVLLFAVVATAVAYLLVDSALVGVPVSLSCGEPYRKVVLELVALDARGLPLATLGLGLGWVYLELGPAVVLLFVVPILIARSAFASYLEVKAGQEQTIETLILALEAKDRYTAGHAQRVATFCEYVGERMGFGTRRMERLRYAALMHDIGKLVVPNQLLNKPGRLTEGEFERVKRHETVSVDLLRRIDFLAPVAGDTTTEAATAAVDGSGLIEPAIIHVADAFDAMTSTRSYRRALSQETAFAELRAGAGTQFNGDCVEALIAAIEDRGEHYGAGHEVDDHDWAVAPPEAGTGSAGLGHLVPEEQVAGS
jgi:HD domain